MFRGIDLAGDCGQSGCMNTRISPTAPPTSPPTSPPTNPAPHRPRVPDQVTFHRQELGAIMGLYGRMVAAGEWRDYGLGFLADVAVFSIFRRAAEHPIYRIEKRPSLRLRQGQYAVIGMDGRVLKRGAELKAVLRVLERKLIRAVR